jgi:hypothetical protein
MAQSKLPEDLEQRLPALAPTDRLALATRLLASVEGPDPDWDDAWSAELDRRDESLIQAGVIGIPAAKVRAIRPRRREVTHVAQGTDANPDISGRPLAALPRAGR